MKTRIASAAVAFALLTGAGAVMAGPRDDAAAALSRLASDPSAEQPPVLSEMGFRDARYAVDKLNPGEVRTLGELLRKYRLELPPNFDDAIRSRTRKTRGPGR